MIDANRPANSGIITGLRRRAADLALAVDLLRPLPKFVIFALVGALAATLLNPTKLSTRPEVNCSKAPPGLHEGWKNNDHPGRWMETFCVGLARVDLPGAYKVEGLSDERHDDGVGRRFTNVTKVRDVSTGITVRVTVEATGGEGR